MALAYDLREENQIGYARRVYRVTLSLAPPELRDQVQIKLALATYKDPDLPVDDRLKTAESLLLEVLSRAESLSVVERQETLGLVRNDTSLESQWYADVSAARRGTLC
jgi:hypothetical protein